MPKVEDAFYIYKISIGYKPELNDKNIETVYCAYYNILPELTVTDSFNNPLYFSQNKIRTTYADVTINNNNFDDLLNAKVYMREENTDENGNVTLVPQKGDQLLQNKQVSLRIFGTNYVKRVYTFRITNELGKELTYTITIDSANYPIYQVIKFPDTNNEQIMQMSSKKFSAIINNREIPGNQYFTNNLNTTVRLAIDKPLLIEFVQGLDQTNNKVFDETHAEITDTESIKYKTYSEFTIYRIYSSDPKTFNHEEYIKINYVPETRELANLFTDGANPAQTITSASKKLTLTYNNNGVYKNSNYIGLDYYAKVSVDGKFVQTNRNGRIELVDAGFYSIEYKDIAGNTHTFNLNSQTSPGSQSQSVNLVNKILVDVESDNYEHGELIDNMVLENQVNFNVTNVNIYGSSLSISATYNGQTIDFGAYQQLTKAGVYQIELSAVVNNVPITTNYTIYLVKPKEQRLGLEFIANNLNNTTSFVTSVLRRDATNPTSVDSDVTNLFRIREGIINFPNSRLYRLRMSPYESGNGLYTVNVTSTYKTVYKPQIDYTFQVLIADSQPIIKANVEFGKEVTKKIVLSWVPGDIYLNYGEVDIKIGENVYNVTANDVNNYETQSVTLTAKGTYNIDISTPSGMILTRYKVIKDDPINTVGIILIVIGSVALVTGVLLFFLLRNKMKVK